MEVQFWDQKIIKGMLAIIDRRLKECKEELYQKCACDKMFEEKMEELKKFFSRGTTQKSISRIGVEIPNSREVFT